MSLALPCPRLGALAVLAIPLLVVMSGCGPGDPADVCGVSGVPPTSDDVQNGFGQALRGGEIWKEEGSWAPGPNASIDIGTLSMVVAFDETGTQTSDLIARRAFPICVPLGERSPVSGNANFEGSFITDASHTGAVAILDEEGGFLVGRFEVEVVSPNDGTEIALGEGAFRLERR